METLGTRMKELLKEKNMSQKMLAQMTGCTEAAISLYIKGDRVPRSSVLSKIAVALDTTSDYLTEGIPTDVTNELDYAKKLIARNAKQMTIEDKKEIIDILLGGGNA